MLDDVEVLGVDEVMWQRCGHKFLTVVYALDEGRRRLLWIGKERTEATLRSFFDWFGGNARNLRAVASDMWQQMPPTPEVNIGNPAVTTSPLDRAGRREHGRLPRVAVLDQERPDVAT